MNSKIFLALLIASAVLMGCAQTGKYPMMGNAIGANDQVQFMSIPRVEGY